MKVRVKVLSSLFISIHPRVAGGGVYQVHANATHLKCMREVEKKEKKIEEEKDENKKKSTKKVEENRQKWGRSEEEG